MPGIWRKIFETSTARIYSLLINFGILILTARILGPTGRGELASIQTWVQLFFTFFNLSLGQIALHRISQDNNKYELPFLIRSLVHFALVASVAAWLAIIYLYSTTSIFSNFGGLSIFLAFAALPFFIWEQYVSYILTATDKLIVYNKSLIYGRTVSIFLISLLLLWSDWGIAGVLIGVFIGQLIVSLGGRREIYSYYSARSGSSINNAKGILRLIGDGCKLHLNAIGTFLFTSAGVLMVNNQLGSESAGQFQLSLQLINVLAIIPFSSSMIIYGKVSEMGPDKAWIESRRIIWKVTIFMAGIGIVAAILAPMLIPAIVGNGFVPAVSTFQLMLIGLLGMTFSTMMTPQWIGRGFFFLASAVSLFNGIINIGLCMVLLPSRGLSGAVVAFLITNLVGAAVQTAMYLYCNRKALTCVRVVASVQAPLNRIRSR